LDFYRLTTIDHRSKDQSITKIFKAFPSEAGVMQQAFQKACFYKDKTW